MTRQIRSKNFIIKSLIAVVAISAIFIWFYWDSSYGKVSQETYEFATALYGACLAKNDSKIEAIEQLLRTNLESEKAIGDSEHQWLVEILETAKLGKWNSAAGMAKKMMNDQIEEVME